MLLDSRMFISIFEMLNLENVEKMFGGLEVSNSYVSWTLWAISDTR
jgi:hypothetical protein